MESVITSPNPLCYAPGDQISGGIGVFGYLTTSTTDATLCMCPPKLLTNVSGFTISSLLLTVRHVNKNYLGGGTNYNPLTDSAVTVQTAYISSGMLCVVLRRSSAWISTSYNNTPLFGNATITFTFI